MINPEKLNFKHLIMTIGNLPSSYVESLSYYECLLWLCNYLENTVIPAVNNNASALEELQGLFAELHSYVENYFDNLDVQEEINNKLDKMAIDGTLTNLIKNYVDPIYQAYETSINEEIASYENRVNNSLNTMGDNIQTINNKVISAVSGAPAGAYATVSDLETADPDHSKIYVVTANGYWYYYDTVNSKWTSGGAYQSSVDTDLSSEIAENFDFSKNLYKLDEAELYVEISSRRYQRYTLLNPVVGHNYACFDRTLKFSGVSFIQYHDTTNLGQYTGANWSTNPIQATCNKLVILITNNSETNPIPLMLLDMYGLTLDNITEFVDYHDTLKPETHLKDIEPKELKGSVPYNLYNPEEINIFDGSYQRSTLYNVGGKKYGLYCINNGNLTRLTSSNNNGHYAVVFAYDKDHNTVGTYANPSGDIEIDDTATVIEVNIINTTTTAYDNVMIIDKDVYSDTDVTTIGFLPYSYFLSAPYYVRNTITNVTPTKPYSGKAILSLGDSFTYMNYYGAKLAELTECTQTPRGFNGANIAYFVADRYTPTGGGGAIVNQTFNAELLASYDIITVMGGTNNYGRSMPLGTINDVPSIGNTVAGEIKYVINKILTLKPSIKLYWITSPYRIEATETAPGGYLPNQAGYTMEELANLTVEICRHYGIPVFDFYHESNWNSYTVKYDGEGALVENIYTNDGLHPKAGSGNGGELLGIQLADFINSH